MSLPERPFILGAGPCGLCVGWNFATNDIAVKIFEKTSELGGLAVTFEDGGYLFDLGPHNLHPKYEDIKILLHGLFGEDLQKYYPTFEIIMREKRVTYPLKGFHVLKVLPFPTMLLAGFDFFCARLKMFLRDPVCDDTFQDWITNRFGKVLYSIYFGPYAEKAWKISGSEISNYVAKRRVPILSLTDYIRRAMRVEAKYKHSEEGHLDSFYLRHGVGQLSQSFAHAIREKSGHIFNRCRVLRVKGRNHRIESLTVEVNGGTHEESTDFLFSTIPLPDLIDLLDMDVPPPVRQAAKELDFCAERLVFVKIHKTILNIPDILYFSDPKIKFNRLYKFNSDYVPKGKSAVCVEYTCNVNDEVWNETPEALYEYTTQILSRHSILKEREIEGFAIRSVEHAYPRFRVGFQQRILTVLGYLSTIRNLMTLGRQGLFSYANIDDVLHMAFRAFEALNTIQLKPLDYSEIFPKHINP